VANAIYIPIAAGAGTYTTWLDYLTAPPNVSYAVELAAGASGASFVVNFTLDDPDPLAGAANVGWTPIWIADPTNGTAKTATVYGSYVFPIRGLQVVFTTLTGTALFAVLQGMSAR
jgi:hypothetical protein